MANKYLIQGETYCGDGTTSAAAASNGAAGAWNNINVLTGTAPAYGALNDGDSVTLRSKTAAGADLTITSASTVYLGKNGLTVASTGVTWVLDDGTVWAGINGTLTISVTANAVNIEVRAYNNIIATEDKLVFTSTYLTATSLIPLLKTNEGVYIEHPKIDLSAFSSSGNINAITMNGHGACIARPKIIAARAGPGSNGIIQFSSSQQHTIIAPEIELTQATSPLFGSLSRNYLIVRGGRVFGAGATTGQVLFNNMTSEAHAELIGFDFPKAMMPTLLSSNPSGAIENYSADGFGVDGGNGAFRACAWGYVDSRNDVAYPVLNSTGPDSAATPWAWKLYPVNASPANTAEVTRIVEYTLTSAAKTITLEVLIADSMTITKSTVWMEVAYLDDTGVSRFQTTRVLGSTSDLDTSSAGWSSTSYGPTLFLKRKLALTTGHNIAQNTVVQVTFKTIVKSASAYDVMFIDGAPVFS